MRIALLTTEYPTEEIYAGGLSSYVQRIAHAIDRSGHAVEVFTLSHVDQRWQDGAIPVHRVRWTRRWHDRLRTAPGLWRWSGWADLAEPSWRLARSLRRRHRTAPFDVVQAASFRACGMVAALRPVAPVVTRVSSFHPLMREASGLPADRLGLQHDHAEALQLRRSAAVYAPSALVARAVSKLPGVIGEVIEPPFFLVTEPDPKATLPDGLRPGGYALFFGSMNRLKGCDRLVRILPLLLDRHPDLTFVFVGQVFPAETGQPFDEFIRTRLAAYGNRILVYRERPHAALLPIVAGARLVALPSRIDNLPNTCLEAMSLGRVVIATRDASFEQLIDDGVSGLLVAQDDDAGLAEAISRVWTMDAAERRRLAAAARRRIDRMSPERAVENLLSLFERVVGGVRPRETDGPRSTLPPPSRSAPPTG